MRIPASKPACLERWCSSTSSHLTNWSPHFGQRRAPLAIPQEDLGLVEEPALLLDGLLTGLPKTTAFCPTWNPAKSEPVILSSRVEVSSMTWCVIGLRSSLLPMDLGLQMGGFSVCLLLPLITSFRFAIDLEQLERLDFFVEILLRFLLPPPSGSWTSACCDLHFIDLLKANQTAGIFRLLFFRLAFFLHSYTIHRPLIH